MWEFGTQELISLIAAIATFSAIGVSLWLALKSKTVKLKVHVKSKILALIILNTGDTKFTINGFGVKNNGKYLMTSGQRYSKLLSIKQQTFTGQFSNQDLNIGQVVLDQGDFVEVALEKFDSSILTKNSKIFIVINCKLYLFKIDYNLIDFEQNKYKNHNYKEYTKEDVQFATRYNGI